MHVANIELVSNYLEIENMQRFNVDLKKMLMKIIQKERCN